MPAAGVPLCRACGRCRIALLAGLAVGAAGSAAQAQINAYNPYADSQQLLPPVAPDGSLRWGTFYKSAALQQAYERLWNLGACRGSNKAITVPVEMNKVVIDTLPEEEFRGVVLGATGTLHGGMLAFAADGADPDGAPTLVATLHPAGVSALSVNGPLPVGALRPGLNVRLEARVDRKGVAEVATALDVITPAPTFKPTAIEPDRVGIVVGTVTRIQADTMWLQVPAGRMRRVAVPLAPDVVVNASASQLDLVAPGDIVSLKGRVWRGEGRLGDGLVFASTVTVTKRDPHDGDRPGTAAARVGTAKTAEPGGF